MLNSKDYRRIFSILIQNKLLFSKGFFDKKNEINEEFEFLKYNLDIIDNKITKRLISILLLHKILFGCGQIIKNEQVIAESTYLINKLKQNLYEEKEEKFYINDIKFIRYTGKTSCFDINKKNSEMWENKNGNIVTISYDENNKIEFVIFFPYLFLNNIKLLKGDYISFDFNGYINLILFQTSKNFGSVSEKLKNFGINLTFPDQNNNKINIIIPDKFVNIIKNNIKIKLDNSNGCFFIKNQKERFDYLSKTLKQVFKDRIPEKISEKIIENFIVKTKKLILFSVMKKIN